MDTNSIEIGDQFYYYCPATDSKRYGRIGTITRTDPVFLIDFGELGTIDLLAGDIKLLTSREEVPAQHYTDWPVYYFLVPAQRIEPKFIKDEKYQGLFE